MLKLWFASCFCLFLTEAEQRHRTKRDSAPPPPVDPRNVHFVPADVAFYLSCPIHSYHAAYTWEHGDKSSSCLQMQSNCLHLIPAMKQESYGSYKCVSREKDYTRVVKEDQLVRPEIKDTNSRRNASSAILRQTLRNLLLALAVHIFFQTWLPLLLLPRCVSNSKFALLGSGFAVLAKTLTLTLNNTPSQ